ncbi:MAG: DUF1016 family protein [Deltaproteobacteria bacterium]|nr:DUF1016 family protein [Deltaproteobacteria bacterium]
MPENNQPQAIKRIYQQVREVLVQARGRALRAVNAEMVVCYWEIGRLIVEEEQRGETRATYGKGLIKELSIRLSDEFGRGFHQRNLWFMRNFYLAYPKVNALRSELSWTHYRLLLRVEKSEARAFYEAEAVNSRWSTRELERQINSLLFERLALSCDKAGLLELAKKGHEIQKPADLVKDPYVLEFTGIKQDERFLEKDLEMALIDKLRQFLLELGKGFAFMARQQRITLDGRHFYIDLVFYNRLTRSFVLIDLKVGDLTHQDLGQMQNPPIGIILCSDKSDAIVRYTLPEDNQQIFASRYKLFFPSEEELAAEIVRERKSLEMEKRFSEKVPDI